MMKKLILITLLAFGTSAANAQEKEEKVSTGFGVGFQLVQFQRDFGIGLNMTSPYFGNGRFAVRLRGNYMFNEHVKAEKTRWSPYSNISLGFVGVAGLVGESIRLYGEGGTLVLFPSSDFSSRSVEIGGYGLFGFEFHLSRKVNYNIEIGGSGIGATADKIVNRPIYSNGLTISTGFRIQL